MRITLSLIFILVLAVFIACQTDGPADIETAARGKDDPSTATGNPAEAPAANVDEHGHVDEAPRIELADAKKAFDEGSAIFIDTRSQASYITERIKGSLNFPMATFEQRVKEVPKGKPIIAYCS